MYLSINSRRNLGTQYLTFESLVNLSNSINAESESFELTVTLVNKVYNCVVFNSGAFRYSGVYKNILMKFQTREDANRRWSEKMAVIDWDNYISVKYPKVLCDTMDTIISESILDDIEALKLICKNLGINLTYINKDTDSIHVDFEHPYCTKRMAKYFKDSLVKIPRAEYLRLRTINKALAIKSGNFYYKNKNCNEAFIRNSML